MKVYVRVSFSDAIYKGKGLGEVVQRVEED